MKVVFFLLLKCAAERKGPIPWLVCQVRVSLVYDAKKQCEAKKLTESDSCKVVKRQLEVEKQALHEALEEATPIFLDNEAMIQGLYRANFTTLCPKFDQKTFTIKERAGIE